MPLDLATAIALANTTITIGKTLIETLKKKGDTELAVQAFEMMEVVRKLRDALDDRAEKQALLAKRTRKADCYWIDGDGPYCTRCWDVADKQVYTFPSPNGWAHCPECKSAAVYDRARADAPMPNSGGDSNSW